MFKYFQQFKQKIDFPKDVSSEPQILELGKIGSESERKIERNILNFEFSFLVIFYHFRINHFISSLIKYGSGCLPRIVNYRPPPPKARTFSVILAP